MKSLTIKADKTHGIADLVFAPNANDPGLLVDLHNTVLPKVDGASIWNREPDFMVKVRKRDFHDVVERLGGAYRARDFDVEIVTV